MKEARAGAELRGTQVEATLQGRVEGKGGVWGDVGGGGRVVMSSGKGSGADRSVVGAQPHCTAHGNTGDAC